ncbi:MAG: response regulator, partial [candidate division WOR-3 bacterium]
ISQWQDSRCSHDIEIIERQLSHDIINTAHKGESVHVVQDFTEPNTDSDNPHVSHTFVGHPVFCYDECIGSLCISFSEEMVLDDNDELLIGIISTAIGIEEERNQVEQQILTQKTFLNNILESLSHPLYVIDIKNYTLKMWNAAANIISPEEHLTCHEAIHRLDSPCSNRGIHCPLEMVKRTKKAQTVEHVHYDRDGNPRTFEVHGHPVLDDNGTLIQVIQYAFDVTDRNRMLEELQKTQKLESLGILAGGIAHDFNNIITAILGNIEILKVYMSTHTHDERLHKIENAVFRARDLIQQLLTFSKGGAPIKKTLSIVELLKESAGFVLRGSNVKCEFSIQEDLWAVEIDESQISQVINNLLLNADQAMHDGGTIRIIAENHIIYNVNGLPLHKGKYVRISIEDHGIGIPEENISKIFDPYFTTKERGNGLGLTTAYSIIRKHDGYITVDSRVGRGSTFSIYLPASDESKKTEQKIEKHVIKGTGNVLVVDDEDTVRDVALHMLNLCGYKADCVTDGAEALELYQQSMAAGHPYDIVIMDLTIPGGLGGKETIKKLLEIDPQAKAIASSGYSSAPVMSEFKKYGFRGVLTKPYRMQELSELLHRILKND